MSHSIVLSVGGVNRTLTLDSQNPSTGQSVFTEKSGPLVGRLRLRARIRPNSSGTVLRSTLALSASKVVIGAAEDGALPKVVYEQVWSHDITVVMASSEADRTALCDLTSALVANADIRSMVINGTDLAA